MEIFSSKDDEFFKNGIRSIDDDIIDELVNNCFIIKKSDEEATIYGKFYKSKYPIQDLSYEENRLDHFLEQMVSLEPSLIKTHLQGKEYNWVQIDKNNIGPIAFRYYFAPNPKNMHEIVKRLTEKFVAKKIPVKFKYQLKGKMEDCDRIILYTDYKNRQDVENAINEIYRQSPHLFENSERPLSWIYKSETPNIYLAPETPDTSYGSKFAKTMKEAKEVFCYLYGITENKTITLQGKDGDQAISYMKSIICSLLLRNGLLMSKDGKIISFNDDINSTYDYKTGDITFFSNDETQFHDVKFSQNRNAKDVFLKNFYGVTKLQSQEGISARHISIKERHRELYEKFGWYRDEFIGDERKKPKL